MFEKKEQINDAHILAHTKWNCKYHIVFAPKYRRKAFYLRDIDRQAETLFSQPVKQMVAQEGITEQLKVNDQMAWVGAMNNIRQRAAETANTELISVF